MQETVIYKGVTLEVTYEQEDYRPATYDQPAEGGEIIIEEITTSDCIADLLSDDDEKSIQQLIFEKS